MRARIALAAVTVVASFGTLAAQAAAQPSAQVCASVSVTVNGETLVAENECLPE